MLRIPKAGKRAAIAAGLAAADPSTDVVVVLDSDTVWAPGALGEMLRPFADPRVGGVTPRQAIFDVGDDPVRRLADWIEDLRYLLTVPAQSVFGQVGCLAGRTIAYRRTAFEPAVDALVRQTVFGAARSTSATTACSRTSCCAPAGGPSTSRPRWCETDAPPDWRTFWRQQLRWGRSSQRETLLSLRWLWRRPVAFATFATDIVTPFALYAVVALGVAHALGPGSGPRQPRARGRARARLRRDAGQHRRAPDPAPAAPPARRAAPAAVRAPAHVRDGPDPDPRVRDDAPPVLVDAARPRCPYELRNEAVLAESAHG